MWPFSVFFLIYHLVKACIPVIALPRISAWISCVPGEKRKTETFISRQ